MHRTQTRPTQQSPKILKRRDRTRQKLIKIAKEKFAAQGPTAVSVDELIEEAEIAKNTFYTYFASKEELLSEIVRPVFERGIEELESVKTQSAHDTARGIANVYLGLWREDRCALTVAKKLGMNHFSLIEDVHTKFSDVLRAKLRTLQKSGNLRNESELFSAQIIARSAILYLEVYSQGENLDEQFRTTIEGLLLKNPKA